MSELAGHVVCRLEQIVCEMPSGRGGGGEDGKSLVYRGSLFVLSDCLLTAISSAIGGGRFACLFAKGAGQYGR